MSKQSVFQNRLDKIIEGLNNRPRLLLHVCCAPCSSYCLEYLRQYFDITVFFYNPNITEETEYLKRRDEEIRLIGEFNSDGNRYTPIDYIIGDYDKDMFFDRVRGMEMCPEGGERCQECFRIRLDESAKLAAKEGFDYFTTTLTISPLKDAAKLNMIGEECAKLYNTTFLPSDFKKRNGYKRSIELSREHDLYRQDYCGCVFSKRDRMLEKQAESMKEGSK